MNLFPAPNVEDVLFETQLTEESSGEAYRAGLRMGNRITCGMPLAYDLAEKYTYMDEKLPFEIRSLRREYEFWLLRLACTLHPADDSALSWAEFCVTFANHQNAIPPNARVLNDQVRSLPVSGGRNNEDPIAYDLYPKEVADQTQVEQLVEISPKFAFGSVSTNLQVDDVFSISLGKDAVAVKHQETYPRITGYGLRESKVCWRFRPGVGNQVEEGIKQMDIIVQKPRHSITQATINIEGAGRKWGFIPASLDSSQQQFYF